MPTLTKGRESAILNRALHALDERTVAYLERYPLTEDQAGILRSIAEAPYPGYGWTWSNDSETRRLLDALAKKGLVIKSGRGTYHAVTAISTAYRAVEQEKAAAYRAQKEAEAAANEAQFAEVKAALDKDKAVLFTALLRGKDEGWLSDAEYTSAYNRVGALKVTKWSGAWQS